MEEFEAHYGAIYMVSIASMFMAALPGIIGTARVNTSLRSRLKSAPPSVT